MFYLNDIEENEKNIFMNFLNCRGLTPRINDGRIFIYNNKCHCIFIRSVDELCISDLNDIFGISIIDSKYVYYLINIALENNNLGFCKKKSL